MRLAVRKSSRLQQDSNTSSQGRSGPARSSNSLCLSASAPGSIGSQRSSKSMPTRRSKSAFSRCWGGAGGGYSGTAGSSRLARSMMVRRAAANPASRGRSWSPVTTVSSARAWAVAVVSSCRRVRTCSSIQLVLRCGWRLSSSSQASSSPAASLHRSRTEVMDRAFERTAFGAYLPQISVRLAKLAVDAGPVRPVLDLRAGLAAPTPHPIRRGVHGRASCRSDRHRGASGARRRRRLGRSPVPAARGSASHRPSALTHPARPATPARRGLPSTASGSGQVRFAMGPARRHGAWPGKPGRARSEAG